MTDTELKRRKAICEAAHVDEIDDVSDGFHTFRQLYYQRMMLFATIVKQNKDKAWKSLRHEDGELCFGGGWFIVGIDTPKGSYTYHYENKYFDLFDCEILDYGKHWDGHTEKDVTRLLSLPDVPDINDGDIISRQAAIDIVEFECGEWRGLAKTIVEEIEKLPSAQPERKKGKWIVGTVEHKYTHEHRDARQCSECGAMYFHYARQEDIEDVVPNFCPNCGADMRGKLDG